MKQLLSNTTLNCLIGMILILSGCTSPPSPTAHDKAMVSSTLDSLHSKASKAEFDGYFDLYSDSAVFHGTDATERWSLSEFKEYTRPHFDAGNGWTYTMASRNIFFSSDGETAWFDELLDNSYLGLTRGTGVLELLDATWKISQYNLTIPIPNELAGDVVSQIRANNE